MKVADMITAGPVVVLLFHDSKFYPSREVISDIAEQGNCVAYAIDVDANDGLSEQLPVTTTPYLVVYKDGEPVNSCSDAEMIKKLWRIDLPF